MFELSNVSVHDGSLVIDKTAILICSYITLTVTCQLLNIFGIVTNIINIVCFVKQGFKDTVNISLLGLAISDLCSLVTLMWICIFTTPAVLDLDLPFDSLEVTYIAAAMPHFAFTRVSSCITAMIVLEKCISVTEPFRVKTVLTPTRTVVITVGIFIVCTFSSTPMFVVSRLGPKLSTVKNKSIIAIIPREDRAQVETVTILINNFLVPFFAFVIIATCTIILAIQLVKRQEWTQKAIQAAQALKMAKRNQKIAKMVATISCLFIACFIPTAIFMLVVAYQPDLSVTRKYVDVSLAMSGFIYLLESINSSMNIFIYHHMSSKYRHAFCQMCFTVRLPKTFTICF